MANEDPNVTVARFNFKQAIVVAAITGVTTISGTLITLRSSNGTPDKNAESVELALSKCQDENTKLNSLLSSSVSFTTLSGISDVYFDSELSESAVKAAIKDLVSSAEQCSSDSDHYMYKLFRLKKLMLANGGNINVRVSNANQEACRIIQDLLQGIEYYRGTLDGNVESTREAVEAFQKKLNVYTPGYFEERNIGIVGKKTFNAIMEHYERS